MASEGTETAAPVGSNSTVPVEYEAERKFVIRQALSASAAIPVLALLSYLFGVACLRFRDNFLGAPNVMNHSIEDLWELGGLILVCTLSLIGIFDKHVRRFMRWRRERVFKLGPRVANSTDTAFMKAALANIDEMFLIVLCVVLLGTLHSIAFAFYSSEMTLWQLRGRCAECEILRTSHGPLRGKIVSANSDRLLLMTAVGHFALVSLDDIQGFSTPPAKPQQNIGHSPGIANPGP